MASSVFGFKEFRHNLVGVNFFIVKDHCALTFLMKIKDPMGRLARWSIFLSQFDFEIVHRKGRLHNNADYLGMKLLRSKDDKRLIVPKPLERQNLIDYAHSASAQLNRD
ncbi:unnamed protein product [Brachionus calyciflorus]|uniref:Reverse transcriptase RNase H-like domain-containing protein n=1 Tax=Brachionus calyciflorus TaxID=104777 RepID=A0A814P6G7_9BILA|nr:unnamed protein product [Brachionus calyciflorus]